MKLDWVREGENDENFQGYGRLTHSWRLRIGLSFKHVRTLKNMLASIAGRRVQAEFISSRLKRATKA